MIKLDPAKTLIVFALESEARGRFDTFAPLYTGVGKVNAAYNLMRRLAEWKNGHNVMPDFVLNLGTAGSKKFFKGSLVNCTRFVQRDFDTTAFGSPPFTTPFDKAPAHLDNGHRFPQHPEGICGTGDNFVADADMTAWNVVDMEAYALAKVCLFENVPFACVKYISDGADDNAGKSWEGILEDASTELRKTCDALFGL